MRRLAVATILLACAAPAGAWPWGHKVHRYKIVSGDGGESVLPGESIRTRGLCVELLLHGRVDTIVCGPKYVTELPDREVEAEPPPAEVKPMADPASREARR